MVSICISDWIVWISINMFKLKFLSHRFSLLLIYFPRNLQNKCKTSITCNSQIHLSYHKHHGCLYLCASAAIITLINFSSFLCTLLMGYDYSKTSPYSVERGWAIKLGCNSTEYMYHSCSLGFCLIQWVLISYRELYCNSLSLCIIDESVAESW